MKLFRKPRDDRLTSSAAKGINNAYHSKKTQPAALVKDQTTVPLIISKNMAGVITRGEMG